MISFSPILLSRRFLKCIFNTAHITMPRGGHGPWYWANIVQGRGVQSERAVLGSASLLGSVLNWALHGGSGQFRNFRILGISVYPNGQCMVLGIARHLRLHCGAGQCTFTGQFAVLGSGQCVLLVRCPE